MCRLPLLFPWLYTRRLSASPLTSTPGNLPFSFLGLGLALDAALVDGGESLAGARRFDRREVCGLHAAVLLLRISNRWKVVQNNCEPSKAPEKDKHEKMTRPSLRQSFLPM